MKNTALFFLVFFLFLSVAAFAQVPRILSYQGVLMDASGDLVPDGNYNITVRLYNTQTGGTALWQEAHLVMVSKGIYNIKLGSIVPLNLSFTTQYWLGVSIGGGTELTPRTQLASSAYSLNKAVKIDGVTGTPSITLNSTTNVEIASITIEDTDSLNVLFSANVVGEINGNGTGRYEFTIRRGSITGNIVGRGWWRPGSSGGLQAATINFNGIDKNVTGPVTYYLVGRKFDGGAMDILIFMYGFNATWVFN
jgi:hypothetical protein